MDQWAAILNASLQADLGIYCPIVTPIRAQEPVCLAP
jgi:hypothetical protein